jgi:hypothetical protein
MVRFGCSSMSNSATVIPFLDRRTMQERERARAIHLEDEAQGDAACAITGLLSRVNQSQHGVALRAALHDVLARLHERGEFDNGEVLAQIEEIARAAIPNLRAPIF